MHIKDTFPELYQIRQRPVSIDGVRAKFEQKRGREFWQSLEELAGSEEFDELLHREFPQHASEWDEGTDRRTFLKLMGASLALAGLSGCSYQPPESIVPYVRQPEGIIPGKALYFATAMPFPGGAAPLLVSSYMGRPTKVEGNDLHPASLGAADVYAQASILNLYDPDRSETIINRGEVRTYTAFLGALATALEAQRGKQGAGLRFLTETVTSPTLGAQMREIIGRFPGARWYQWEPAGGNNGRVGVRQATGGFATPVYNFAAADRVVSLDSNFLECGPGALRYARDFASRRRVTDGDTREQCRLYAFETTPSNTGYFADHRVALRPSQFAGYARGLAAAVGATGAALAGGPAVNDEQIKNIADDLKAHMGACLVIAGDEQPPEIHALAHAMNAALGAAGKTVAYLAPVEENATDQSEDLRALVSDIDSGAVDILVIVGGNPVYTTPADLKLDAARMKKVKLAVHLSQYDDETSELCHWHIPETHYLETWGDARAYDGTVTIQQPLITPLYNGKSAYELLAAFTDNPDRRGYDIVRQYWMNEGRASLMAAGTAAAAGAGQSPFASSPPPGGSTGAPQSLTPGNAVAANGSPASADAATRNATVAGSAGTGGGQSGAAQGGQSGAAQGGQSGAASGAGRGAAPAQGGAAGATAGTADAAFERAWRKVLNDGFVPNTAKPVRGGGAAGAPATGDAGAEGAGTVTRPETVVVAPPAQPQGTPGGGAYEIVFRTDPSIYDGRFANNGWLQELPKPLTKLTWDNAAIISPATAAKLGVGTEPDGALLEEGQPRRVNRLTYKGGEVNAEVVRLNFRGRTVTAPVFILPGQPDDVVTIHLGYGRWRSGRVGGNKHDASVRGANAYDLRTSDAMWSGAGLGVEVTGDSYSLACTQIHFRMEGREIVRHGTFAEWAHDPTLAPEREHKKEPPQPAGENRKPIDSETMYEPYDYSQNDKEGKRGYKWGMVIDTATCVGCNACVVACQAENNIPVVGKEQVSRSREMHWLRIDSYFRGAAESPDGVYFMPVPCMHCENAPCEPVCPVHATVHSSEGLNDMVYNRCVGTRYCSNNCPYKVRRFNFLLYQDWDTPSLKMMRNPEVTVRSRGVMEKCTYCVQRIEHAKIDREKKGERVRDGDIKTACQQTCPTEAIVFGDLNDPNSRVAKLHAQKRRYDLLADLNTRPRTAYLASVRNPNEAVGGAGERRGGSGASAHGGEA
ncbi:MAG TPA: TAT-variant-translocated molybdopterin oxidoreductase [Pyrinomonadaceae bacterium]|jgi:MoCo/4Fe-4S cofactor protein with predicted Tat translocation signal